MQFERIRERGEPDRTSRSCRVGGPLLSAWVRHAHLDSEEGGGEVGEDEENDEKQRKEEPLLQVLCLLLALGVGVRGGLQSIHSRSSLDACKALG